MPFDLDNYEPVASRLGRWLEWCATRNLTPRVVTHLVHYTDQRCVFRCELYTIDDTGHEIMLATGWEEETRGEGMVNRTSHLANCETGALGRALANLGLSGTLDPAKRPSREEMAKVQRLTPVHDDHDQPGQRVATEKQRGYIRRLAADRGLTDLAAIEQAIEQVLGQLVPVTLLTPAQASRVIEAWKAPA